MRCVSACLRFATANQNRNFFITFFIFSPPHFFLLIGDEKFSVLISSYSEESGNALIQFAKGQKFLPPDPLPFCPFALTPAGRARRWLQNKNGGGWIKNLILLHQLANQRIFSILRPYIVYCLYFQDDEFDF